MRFEWDEEKNRRNLLKHAIGFETAVLVFDDPLALTQRDPFRQDEERWITMGLVERSSLLLVVHTWFEYDGEETIRIISARRATQRERKQYEEAHQTTEKGYRRYRRQGRRRH